MSFFCACCAPAESSEGQFTEGNHTGAVGFNAEYVPETPRGYHENQYKLDTAATADDSPTSPLKNADKTLSKTQMTPEEKEAEKVRLQKMVKEFAKEAVKGIPMTIMNSDGKKGSVIFLMESYLRSFTLEEKAGETEHGFVAAELRKVDMKQVESIYRGNKILKRNPWFADPDYATEYIGLEVRPTKHTVFFHVPDDYARDKFYTCVKILRLSVEVKG